MERDNSSAYFSFRSLLRSGLSIFLTLVLLSACSSSSSGSATSDEDQSDWRGCPADYEPPQAADECAFCNPPTYEKHAQAVRCKGLSDECLVYVAARANYLMQMVGLDSNVSAQERSRIILNITERLNAATASPEAVCAADVDEDLIADERDQCLDTGEFEPVGPDGCPVDLSE